MTMTAARRRVPSRRRGVRNDLARGAVTAEIAVALPSLVAAVIGALWMVVIALAQLRCADAAREAVRAAARGEQPTVVSSLATEVAPDGATVAVGTEGDVVTVTVAVRVPVPLPFGDQIPAPTVRAKAVAAVEYP